TQRLLWASTSTKNAAYSDTKYVEPLIGPQTVTTMPLETLEAYRDHGNPAVRLTEKISESEDVLAQLEGIGIDLARIAEQLEDEGVQKFVAPYDKLLASIEKKLIARAPARGITPR
ncbi:MAG TPA: transaldolase family protein, partial [Burkholderiaceae bacterium]|nr:transaldolase family protein [Burkholderiaceae bacterium]